MRQVQLAHCADEERHDQAIVEAIMENWRRLLWLATRKETAVGNSGLVIDPNQLLKPYGVSKRRVGTKPMQSQARVISRTLARRLERLEAHLAPASDEPALIIHLTCVGQEDRIIEVRGDNTADRRRRPWPPRRAAMDSMQ